MLNFSLKPWPRDEMERQAYVDPIFANIAGNYDFMTRVLSLGCERQWKKQAVKLAGQNRRAKRILDLATGTAEFPLHLREAGFDAEIIGLDRNQGMLGIATQKCKQQPEVKFLAGDLMHIPLKNNSFDVITMGYGLRYVADIRQTLAEVFRLLRHGGIFVSLDFGLPRSGFYRRVCFGYLLLLGSLWGLILHRKGSTYWHIVESLKAYPGQAAVKGWMMEVGFDNVTLREQLGGIVTIFSAVRSRDHKLSG